MNNQRDGDSARLNAAAAGDTSAFHALYETHVQAVFRYSYSIVRNRDQAADCAQEAFTQLWRRRRRVTIVGTSMLPWLLVAVRYASLKAVANRGREVSRADLQSSRGTPSAFESTALRADLDREIRRLDEVDRAIVARCLLVGESYAEAAAGLGITTASVRNRLSRARRRLRTALAEYGV